jgi:two-component system sensor histidine kinase DegS
MRGDPYTQRPMEPARAGTDARDSRFDGLHAEAKAAVGYSANTLRSVRERYREAYSESLSEWQSLRDEMDAEDRSPNDLAWARTTTAPVDRAADAAEAGADDFRRRALRSDVETMTIDLGDRQAELAKLELAERSLERTWLFLERGDATLITEVGVPATENDAQMRIVEAQEAERSRLAQEVHDGPAQALSNTIFQVEYIERIIDTDPLMARTELRFLRELLRRELGDVRAFISQLRPPMLDQLGLDGAIDDTVDHMRTLTGLAITTDLEASPLRLSDAERTVALRITQEALQNVRKHAAATNVAVATHHDETGDWVLEIRDDGRGFDVGAVAARGRRNFGLQFMRERAELIGARFDVRSRPDGGTIVRLTIPNGDATGGEEST